MMIKGREIERKKANAERVIAMCFDIRDRSKDVRENSH